MEWVVEYVKLLIPYFGLQNWVINIKFDLDTLKEYGVAESNVGACVETLADYLQVTMHFQAGMPDNLENRHTVLHEVFEIALAPLIKGIENIDSSLFHTPFVTSLKEAFIEQTVRGLSPLLCEDLAPRPVADNVRLVVQAVEKEPEFILNLE